MRTDSVRNNRRSPNRSPNRSSHLPTRRLSARKKLHILQKRIFSALQTQVHLLLGESPASILKYENESQMDFQGFCTKKNALPLKALSKARLLEEVLKADVCFIGDFHTFDQSQRTALRIIRNGFELSKNQFDWVIGLELVPSQKQKVLDQFQKGEISEEKFLSEISYQQEWGFPWANYRPLFEWAKANQVRMIALNRPKGFGIAKEEKELHDRDFWAAGVITDLYLERNDAAHKQNRNKNVRPLKTVVLYGEHHVGSLHLPRQIETVSRKALRTPLKWVTLHQNYAPLYWKVIEKKPLLRDQAIVLKKGVYCLFSSTPWAKLQSLINWAEKDILDTELDPEEGLDLKWTSESQNEAYIDYLSLMRTYGVTLADFLNLPPPQFEALSLYTINEAGLIQKKLLRQNYTPKETTWIASQIESNRSLYLSRIGIGYLGSPSHHRVAELAGFHLYYQNYPNLPYLEKSENGFYRIILAETFAYFCSMILNPHRKCDLPADHQKRLRFLNKLKKTRSHSKQSFPNEAIIRTLVLEILKSRGTYLSKSTLKELRSHSKSSGPILLSTGRFLGKILGKSLHEALVTEKIRLSEIQEIFGLFDRSGLSSQGQKESPKKQHQKLLSLLKVRRHRSKLDAL